MAKYEELTAEQLTSAEFYQKLFESDQFKDPLSRQETKYRLQLRAKELRVKTKVDEMLRVLDKKLADAERQNRKSTKQNVDTVTDFTEDSSGVSYPNMYCGSWIATEDGIWSQESSRANQTACYHPILPIRRMRNIETGEEQITLAFKRGGQNRLWSEITIPKETVANSRSIISLAKYGISVNSETAKLLVRYLSDVENYNDDLISLVQSSSKLGWQGKDFLPYDKRITFDAATRFAQLFQSIAEVGSYRVWLEHVKKIRAGQFVEPRIALAASFSSVLIKMLGIASVIVDFWGMTEAGKTVMLMLAASVWACPDEGQYIGDFLTTDTELEVRADVLNNLPLILDDTAKMKKSIQDNIEQVIYNLSSGSGKKRSNKELGSERVRTWKNATIVNGERPLNSFVEQGGAINRILEIGLTEERLFDSPQETAETVRRNYGFAGKMFVEAVKEMDPSEILKLHKEYTKQLETRETMQKQVLSMAAVLTADKLATDVIFQDGKNLTIDEVKGYLTNRSQVSDGARCYEYLMGVYAEKQQHFMVEQTAYVDQWGKLDRIPPTKEAINIAKSYGREPPKAKVYINFYVNSFCELLRIGGYSRKSFTAWAKREGLLRCNTSKGRDIYAVRNSEGGPQERFISVLVVQDLEEYQREKHIFD